MVNYLRALQLDPSYRTPASNMESFLLRHRKYKPIADLLHELLQEQANLSCETNSLVSDSLSCFQHSLVPDCTILVVGDSSEIPAHLSILTARSPFLERRMRSTA
jgi:hypothetical protein